MLSAFTPFSALLSFSARGRLVRNKTRRGLSKKEERWGPAVLALFWLGVLWIPPAGTRPERSGAGSCARRVPGCGQRPPGPQQCCRCLPFLCAAQTGSLDRGLASLQCLSCLGISLPGDGVAPAELCTAFWVTPLPLSSSVADWTWTLHSLIRTPVS